MIWLAIISQILAGFKVKEFNKEVQKFLVY